MRILIECGSTLNEDICRNMNILYGSSLNKDPYIIGILIQKFALGNCTGDENKSLHISDKSGLDENMP